MIADNLGWFRDENVNIEDIMREKGERVITNLNEQSVEFMEREFGNEEVAG